MDKQKVGLVIMRPTEECNLRCKYCYSAKSSDLKIMSTITLANAIRKTLGFYTKITYVWYGGEATLAGLDFFREILFLEKKYSSPGQKIINEIQTNGILVDDKWAEFFSKNKFYVGVSIDGPKEINDMVRLDRNGNGAYNRIIQGIRTLKKYGINVAGICVLANHNIKFVREIINLYKEEGIALNINPFVASGIGFIYINDLQVLPSDYGKAMIQLFNYWFSDPSIKIYDFYKIVKSFFTGLNNICCYSGKCSSEYISICPNGDVYPCGRWAGEKDFRMGNIDQDSLENIVNSRTSILFSKRTSVLKECRRCEWFSICNGGCPHTSFLYTGDINNKDFYCEGKRMLFEHIYSIVNEQLKSIVQITR